MVALLIFLVVGCNDGPAGNPDELVFIFQKQADPAKVQANADRVADYLAAELGMPVRAQVPGDYSASVQALISRRADVAYVSAMPFLLARRDGDASLLLAEQRTDPRGVARTEYDSVFVVPKDSSLQSLSDLVEHAGDIRMVFTSPTSTSGYIMAYARLVHEGLIEPEQDPREVFKSVAFGGGYTQALEEVLAGRGDVAAVSYYTVEGPNTRIYLGDDQLERLRVLDRTSGVPTHLFCVRGGLDETLRERIKAALLSLSDEHPELLADVYGASRFVEVDENEHVAAAVEAIEYIGLPIHDLAR